MRRRALAVLALAALGAAALAATAGAGSSSTTSAQAVNCRGPVKLAIVTPLTGGGGFIGQEQLTWTKYGIKVLSKKYGLRVQLVQADTPVEKGPGEALVVSQKLISDPRVLAVIGPATSGGAASASQALTAAGIVQISPSATRTSLTKGATKEATSSFFRVVPGDYVQGPTDATYMVDKLNAKRVVVIDFQEPYSVGLADAAPAREVAEGLAQALAEGVEHGRRRTPVGWFSRSLATTIAVARVGARVLAHAGGWSVAQVW